MKILVQCIAPAAALVLLGTGGCVTDRTPAAADAPRAVSIMTFNVENLFDTLDDPGKDDATYLPLAAKQTDAHRAGCAALAVDRWRDQCLNYDWNERALGLKLRALARAILQVENGRGPDILVLQEVENRAVVERLRREHLAAAGYRATVLIDGADRRGIDVAFLARPAVVGEPVLHEIAFSGFDAARVDDTRGILEATFRLPDGELLSGFAVHFPAPFHPHEMREQAYAALNDLRMRLPPGRLAFAAGDFNTPAAEDREYAMLDRLVRPGWLVAHEQGCRACPGTYFYPPQNSWSFLDMILWSRPGRGENATWRLRAGSVRLVNRADGQADVAGRPLRFELPSGRGISDHWPLLIEIEPTEKQ